MSMADSDQQNTQTAGPANRMPEVNAVTVDDLKAVLRQGSINHPIDIYLNLFQFNFRCMI